MHVHQDIVEADLGLMSVVFRFIVVDRIAELLVKIFKLHSIIAFEFWTQVVFRIIIYFAHS